METEFCLETYLQKTLQPLVEEPLSKMEQFDRACKVIQQEFEREWNDTDDLAKNRKLEREKRAIMGYDDETRFYKEKIREMLGELKLQDCWYPPWYPNLTEGIFAELYGLAGVAPWAYDMEPRFVQSSSAKIIGNRIYCLLDGKVQLMPQQISDRRREQLKRTLLLASPTERLEYGFHEVYLRNGIRITIYSGSRTKQGQDIIVFRKYVLGDLSFEALVRKGTIPAEAVALFKQMIAIGFNVLFAGQVRSGKTTFLQIWQKQEDSLLEGVAVATDPETPWHKIMPEAPIMQLIADGKQLEDMTKSLLRGDNDYLLMEEMRDGIAFRLALDMTSTGTARSKATIHDRDGVNIPYKMASKIRERYGGDEQDLIAQVFQNFDYVIELVQSAEDKSRKIMRGILEYHYDMEEDKVFCRQICQYDFDRNQWLWNRKGAMCKLNKYPEAELSITHMGQILESLWEQHPLGDVCIYPAYYRGNRHGCE